MKRLKKFLIALTSLFSVVALFPLSACSGGAMHTLTLVNENEVGGRLTGEGSYKTGSQVTVSYSANKGYKFDKWDIDGETIKMSNRIYTFKMPDKDITVKGNFVAKIYELDVKLGYYGAGEVTGSGEYAYNSEVTVTCTVNTGFAFVGWWSDTDNKYVSTDTTYTFKMPAKDYDLHAMYEQVKYNVTIVVSDPEHISAHLSSSSSGFIYKNTYSVTYSIINNSDTAHYAFTGLYEYVDGKKGALLSETIWFTMPAHDLTIYVEVTRDFKLTIQNGDFSNTSSYVVPGKEVDISAGKTSLATFLGWYDESDNLISSELDFKFTMPEKNTCLISKYSLYANSVSFGVFPRTQIKDEETLNALSEITETNSRGYIEYNDKQYIKIDKITHYARDYTNLYFEVEPIKWMKFKTNDPDITGLLCLDVIAAGLLTAEDKLDGFFYSNSSVREYLNNDFINKAFSEEEQNKLLDLFIDQKCSNKIVDKNTYDGECIRDKVFIPGVSDFSRSNTDCLYYKDVFVKRVIRGSYTDYMSYHSNKITHYINDDFYGVSSLARDYDGVQYEHEWNGNCITANISSTTLFAELRPIIYMRGL